MRVLIVESDALLRRNLRQTLESWDSSGMVAEASTPAQALTMASEALLDMILLGLSATLPAGAGGGQGTPEAQPRLPPGGGAPYR